MINCIFENGNKASLRHVVVDAICLKNNQIILVKRAPGVPSPGKWAIPGGFVDRDETCEQAALRELKEETGYSGKIGKLIKVIDNPNRKNEERQNISFVYLINVVEKVGEHDDEVKAVEWFDLDKLPKEDDFAFDHYQIIQDYLKSKLD